jgi:mono/diheme cytochrome c family protein
VFQEKCAACHGPAANGSNLAPDLLPSMHAMGPRRFAAIVLQRYDWGMPAGRVSIDSTTRRGLTDEDLRSEDTAPIMPAWADEPRVRGHIADLYAWLTARAQGTEGAGEPAR